MKFNLNESDNKVYSLIEKEKERQKNSLIMIPSESLASRAILEANGSILNNKYSEGYPKKRYYTGNKHIDEIEDLAIERAKRLFGAEHVNVQPHSGSSANTEAYMAVLKPGDKILGLNLSHGGHLTHGHPINISGILYKFSQYTVDKYTQLIDMDKVRELALEFKPKMIISGFTAYPRKVDFKKFHEIAKEVGAYSLADISHIAGLIVGEEHPSPFPFTDIITTTTHKTLCGPRGAIIMCKKELAENIDKSVFPGSQGGPLDHVIAAKAVCFKEAIKPEFKEYIKQVVKNAKILAEVLMDNGIKLVTNGTDTHLILIDLTPFGVGLGKEISNTLAKANIYTNKNTIPFDPSSPFNPSGIRLGTPILTQRGMKEEEMKQIGGWISRIIKSRDEQLVKNIGEEIKQLTSKFPIY